MSEKLSYTPQNEVSHASLDKEIYGMDLSDAALEQQFADNAAAERVKSEYANEAYEKAKREQSEEALGEAAVKTYLRSLQGLGPVNPTDAFAAKQEKWENEKAQLDSAGRTDTLNNAFAYEVEKVTDEDGTIDIDKLNPDDLVRYKSSLGVLLGEDADDYDTRMRGVFGTGNYMDTVTKLVDERESQRLRDIARRNPGANPLADNLLTRWEDEKATESPE